MDKELDAAADEVAAKDDEVARLNLEVQILGQLQKAQTRR